MRTFRFVARNAAEALDRIQAELGPEAVVLSVKKIQSAGGLRFWRSEGGIEVVAGIPDPPEDADEKLVSESPIPPRAGTQAWISAFKRHGHPKPANAENPSNRPAAFPSQVPTAGRWRTVSLLESLGLWPMPAERLQSHLELVNGPTPPPSLEDEWAALATALAGFWTSPPPLDDDGPARPHVFIGPGGSGKTTVLCKWLTLEVLTRGRNAKVWRLDAAAANTAEFLSIHCEMLGTPLERFWDGGQNSEGTFNIQHSTFNVQGMTDEVASPGDGHAAELLFVDLPGVDANDPDALTDLRRQLATLPSPRLHLVLNAAYETNLLLAQWRAFSSFGPEDLIFTHLDEAIQPVRLWNFVLGTNCTVRFLSAGQKIPGELQVASPRSLLPAGFAR